MAIGPARWVIATLLIATISTVVAGTAATDEGATAPQWRPGDPIPSLREAFRDQFAIGAAIGGGMLQRGDTRRFLEHQFSVVVPESELKPLTLEPREGHFDFAAADAIVDWASRRGIKVRGNCLIWHLQEPPWMFTQDGKRVSRELLVQRMRAYIHEVVGHFRGRIWAWDVVNEAFVAGEPGAEGTHGWRRSGWYDVIGPDYVSLAFQFAHEADPGALLFYNDYETQNPVRRSMILELIRSLKERGIAIDGIGHQSHLTVTHPDPAALEAAIQAVAGLGLRNQITEMDITLRKQQDLPVPPVTPDLVAQQDRRWAEFFRMFRRNADRIDAVVLWGVNDETSWLTAPDQPLLFEQFRPKAAFWAVLEEAKSRP